MESQFSVIALYAAVCSFAVAALALVVAVRGDLRKAGIDIRSDISLASSIYSKEQWVSEVRLENVKDRAVTIYKIYLEVGHGLYLEVEDFSEAPQVLGPYSVYQKKYDPVEFYSGGMSRLTGVFGDKKERRRIVLATSQGRYVTKAGVRAWDDPMVDSILNNYWTGIVRPERLTHKGRSYGSNARYLVVFGNSDGTEEVVPMYPEDVTIRRFRKFSITDESLESKESLESHLRKQAVAGNLTFNTLQVIDMEYSRKERLKNYLDTVAVTHQGWFEYRILGRCFTLWENWTMNRKNKKLRAGK